MKQIIFCIFLLLPYLSTGQINREKPLDQLYYSKGSDFLEYVTEFQPNNLADSIIYKKILIWFNIDSMKILNPEQYSVWICFKNQSKCSIIGRYLEEFSTQKKSNKKTIALMCSLSFDIKQGKVTATATKFQFVNPYFPFEDYALNPDNSFQRKSRFLERNMNEQLKKMFDNLSWWIDNY